MRISIAILVLVGASCLFIPAIKSQTVQRAAPKSNRPPVIDWIKPDRITFGLCPFFEPSYMLGVEVKASDPDGDSISYEYFVTEGRILGHGHQVQWDLRTALGQQRLTVVVTDNEGRSSSKTAQVDVVVHTACDPPCTLVSVSGPTIVPGGEIATFAASVTGPVPDPETLRFAWTPINGEIVGGQGTDFIRVKATGAVGAELQVTVDVGGLDPSCSRQASATSKIQRQRTGSQ